MNNHQYLSALKRALANMKRESRDEILREIQSHADETGESQSLHDHFGPVEELARQYLEGEDLQPSVIGRFGRIGKKLVFITGALVLVLIVAAVILASIFSGDKFDYANEKAEELDLASSDWKSVAWDGPIDLKIDQAHVVIYWKDDHRLSWSCKGRNELNPASNQPIKIRHGYCLLFMPLQTASIDMSQSSVVLVNPKQSVNLEIQQGDLRIAENEGRYQYQIISSSSNIGSFKSHPEVEYVISINANESSVTKYD